MVTNQETINRTEYDDEHGPCSIKIKRLAEYGMAIYNGSPYYLDVHYKAPPPQRNPKRIKRIKPRETLVIESVTKGSFKLDNYYFTFVWDEAVQPLK